MLLLAFLFFVTALLYASVGFGDGSTYNALLVLSGTDYRVLPAIALACNIIVVAGAVWRFGAAGEGAAGARMLLQREAPSPACWRRPSLLAARSAPISAPAGSASRFCGA